MMHLISFTTFTLLCVCSLFLPVLSLECAATQYLWPSDKPQFCCNKCPPGQYMIGRNKKNCTIQCEPCTGKRYTDRYNVGSCIICKNCAKVNMQYVSTCNGTHDAVCRCSAGYRCAGEACSYCEPAPAPDTTTLPPTTSALPQTTTDTVWFLVIISFLCAGIILAAVMRIKTVLKWLTHTKGHCLERKAVPVTVFTEEEEDVCKPIQEMCGKCDQPIEVC